MSDNVEIIDWFDVSIDIDSNLGVESVSSTDNEQENILEEKIIIKHIREKKTETSIIKKENSINTIDDLREYQHDLYNYLNNKYFKLNERINNLYTYVYNNLHIYKVLQNISNVIENFYNKNYKMINNLIYLYLSTGNLNTIYNKIIYSEYKNINNDIQRKKEILKLFANY